MKIISSEITPYKNYLNRRKFIKSSLATGVVLGTSTGLQANHLSDENIYANQLDEKDSLNSFYEKLFLRVIFSYLIYIS